MPSCFLTRQIKNSDQSKSIINRFKRVVKMQKGYILPLNRKISTLEQYPQANSANWNMPLLSSKDMLFNKSNLKNVSQESKNINFDSQKSKIYKVGTFGRIEEIERKQNEIEDFYNRKIKKDWKICKLEYSGRKKAAQQQSMIYFQPKTKKQTLLKMKASSSEKDAQMPAKLELQSKTQLESKQNAYKTSFYKKDVLLSSETDAWHRSLKSSRKRLKVNSEIVQHEQNLNKSNLALQISTIKVPITPYDEHGCLRETGQDLCDCFNSNCQGCWWLCPSCQKSRKCGLSCRCNRSVIPDELLNKTILFAKT